MDYEWGEGENMKNVEDRCLKMREKKGIESIEIKEKKD